MTEDRSIEKITMQRNLVILKQWNTVADHDVHYMLITITEEMIKLFDRIESLAQRVSDKES